jgi:hypothetical protein
MVKLTKRPLPDGTPLNSERHYSGGVVWNMLIEDCLNKCYICEDKPKNPVTEHIIPHKGNKVLKYDWNNLLLACDYCNNIKGDKYDNVINPLKCDPEKHIRLYIEDLKGTVTVEALDTNANTLQTAELLDYVYNGGKTDKKTSGSINFRKEQLLPDIKWFMVYIENHRDEPNDESAAIITDEINRASKFAAFKRDIIRSSPDLNAQFGSLLQGS